MLSLLINAKPKKTILIFPNAQKLWSFFAYAEVNEFRIESSKRLFVGKLRRSDIEIAKKLGANEL